TLDLAGATQTVTVGDSTTAATDLTISALTQDGSLSKAGTGSLALTNGGNSYTGVLNLSGGVFTFGSSGLNGVTAINFIGPATLQWASGNTDNVSSKLNLGTVVGT